jgi:MFS family permease
MGWKVFPPHRWVAFAVFFWGTVSSVQAATHTWAGLMVCRFLLAIPEAMYGPAVPLYLSYFYPRERLGLRVGLFLSGSALANAYGGALAYGISQARGAIAPWRILFLVEGTYSYSNKRNAADTAMQVCQRSPWLPLLGSGSPTALPKQNFSVSEIVRLRFIFRSGNLAIERATSSNGSKQSVLCSIGAATFLH